MEATWLTERAFLAPYLLSSVHGRKLQGNQAACRYGAGPAKLHPSTTTGRSSRSGSSLPGRCKVGLCRVSSAERRGGVSVSDREEPNERPQRHMDGASSSGAATPGSDQPVLSGQTKVLATVGVVGGLVLMVGAGILFKGQIRHFLEHFIELVETWGPGGYAAYGVMYTLLEVLAVPAIPLTMTAGVIFGIAPGVAVVSASATAAATISFLIARYLARDRVLAIASKDKRFSAIDRAIGRNGFRVVTLLRLSPLLPLALSNYIYGLTSVDLPAYVAGSWLGMLPGTIAYVTAGSYGRALLEGGEAGLGVEPWQVAVGLGVTLFALAYIGRLAKQALDEIDEEDAAK